MIKNNTLKATARNIFSGSSPEAREMRKIFVRMLRDELNLVKLQENQKKCSLCKKLNLV